MIVLVDTPVWSLALRRKRSGLSVREQSLVENLAELIREGRAQLIGVVRQELLSGIREEEQFRKLRNHLRAFEDPALEVEDYEEAARMMNACRRRGIAGSTIDLLICAIAHRRRWQVLTSDQDFARYAQIVGIKLLL